MQVLISNQHLFPRCRGALRSNMKEEIFFWFACLPEAWQAFCLVGLHRERFHRPNRQVQCRSRRCCPFFHDLLFVNVMMTWFSRGDLQVRSIDCKWICPHFRRIPVTKCCMRCQTFERWETGQCNRACTFKRSWSATVSDWWACVFAWKSVRYPYFAGLMWWALHR